MIKRLAAAIWALQLSPPCLTVSPAEIVFMLEGLFRAQGEMGGDDGWFSVYNLPNIGRVLSWQTGESELGACLTLKLDDRFLLKDMPLGDDDFFREDGGGEQEQIEEPEEEMALTLVA